MNAAPIRCGLLTLLAGLAFSVPGWSQEPPPESVDPVDSVSAEQESSVADRASDTLGAAQETINSMGDVVDENAEAAEIKAGLLKPIYKLAESFAFPAFHWLAFGLMVLGVVSYALQLTLGKLIVLGHAGFSPKEILSDLVGLAVSVIGLVLTTQAATENSSFTTSPAAVLSSAGVGLLLGILFYLWGQSQEIEAARGRSQREDSKKAGSRDT